jgi:hypothetical protein
MIYIYIYIHLLYAVKKIIARICDLVLQWKGERKKGRKNYMKEGRTM